MFETSIGRKGSSTYTVKDASIDIFALANKIVVDGLIKHQNSRGYLSTNILQVGINQIVPSVNDLNTVNAKYAIGLRRVTDAARVKGDNTNKRASTNRRLVEEGVVDTKADKAYMYYSTDGQNKLIKAELLDITTTI